LNSLAKWPSSADGLIFQALHVLELITVKIRARSQ